MKRAPIVIGSTAVGLGLVLSFHTHTPKLANVATGSPGAAPGGTAAPPATTDPGSTNATQTNPTTATPTNPATTIPSPANPATTGPSPANPATTAPTPATTPRTAAPATTSPTTATPPARSATSEDVQYRYGDIELKVTEAGSRITNIQVVRDGAVDMRSEEINSQAVPMLQQQAMSAQSANIDGVSGATFTSAAYAQALQSALDQLGR